MTLADLIADNEPETAEDRAFVRAVSSGNPFRNAAISVELGTDVCRSLMSRADWREMFEIQLDQLKTVRNAVANAVRSISKGVNDA